LVQVQVGPPVNKGFQTIQVWNPFFCARKMHDF
jgi:hypothetical protein